ncbi:hypothetical protein TURU_001135 [Turdus rufiventris]|nr:hypothetical protein TURU_001135 [Turdus rufiventris]
MDSGLGWNSQRSCGYPIPGMFKVWKNLGSWKMLELERDGLYGLFQPQSFQDFEISPSGSNIQAIKGNHDEKSMKILKGKPKLLDPKPSLTFPKEWGQLNPEFP